MAERRASFLRKIVASVLLVALIPLLFASAITYVWSRHSLYEEQLRFTRSQLQQVVSSFELTMGGIHDLGMSLAYDPAFVRFDQLLASRPYERLLALGPEALVPTDAFVYLDLKQSCFEKLMALKSIGAYIHSVYYVNYNQGVVLTDTYSTQALASFRDRGWTVAYETSRSPFSVIGNRIATDREGALRDVATLVHVFSGPAFSPRRSGLIVNIDKERLYAQTNGKIILAPGACVLVTFRDGERIMPKRPADAAFPDRLPAPPSVQREARVVSTIMAGGAAYLAVAAASPETDWIFWMLVPERFLTGRVVGIVTTNWVLSFAILLATAALGFLVSVRVYNPIRQILRLLGSVVPASTPSGTGGRPQGEMHTIEDGIRRISDDRLHYLSRVEEMIPLYRRMVLHEIVKGNLADGVDLEEQFRVLRMPVGTRDVVVFAVNTRTGDSLTPQSEEIQILEGWFESKLFHRFSGMLVDRGEDHVVGVANCPAAGYGDFTATIRNLWDAGSGVHPSFGVVGIGRHCASIADAHLSYADAREAMRYSILRHTGAVVGIGEAQAGGDLPWSYPQAAERATCVHVALGDKAGALESYRRFVGDLEARAGPVHSLWIQHQFLRLLGAVEEQLQAHGIVLDEMVGGPASLYRALSDMDGTALRGWFESLVGRASDAIRDRVAGRKFRHTEDLDRLLQKDCGITISLEAAAERLGLNPSYLSRIVRETTGKSFVEHITSIRIGKGKLLLADPGLTIADIAIRVGYSNANYFIRIFKENTGITPGQYRKGPAASADAIARGKAP